MHNGLCGKAGVSSCWLSSLQHQPRPEEHVGSLVNPEYADSLRGTASEITQFGAGTACSPGLAQHETAGLWPRREGFTDTITMQTPNNPAIVPQGPIELSTRNKNIRVAVMIYPKRHEVYNPTLPFWQISPVIIQYKILQPHQATQFDQDRPGILVLP